MYQGKRWTIGLLPDTQNCGLRMRGDCRERFSRHRLQRKLLVSDPGMQHGTCMTHVPWCMSGSLICGNGENVPGIPGACATRNFAYLVRGPWWINPYHLFFITYANQVIKYYFCQLIRQHSSVISVTKGALVYCVMSVYSTITSVRFFSGWPRPRPSVGLSVGTFFS